jgi:NAD-dependent deacetylase
VHDKVEQVGKILKNARRILFITGAGVSAESGIPTFRGATAAFPDGTTEEGVSFEEALSHTMFVRKPSLSWKYFFLLEMAMRGKLPNAAHLAISKLQSAQCSVCVATQNIDGLHQSAGSDFVLELHGNLRRIICTACDYRQTFDTFERFDSLPRCPKCKELLRPDAVLYEESLPIDVLDRFEDEQRTGFDIVFSIGTTSLFPYVTQPVLIAARRGIPVVEINPDETPVSQLTDFRFSESAGKILSRVVSIARS